MKGMIVHKGRKGAMNEMTRPEVYQRVHELKTQGVEWPEIIKTLESEGFRDSTGKPYTKSNISSNYSRRYGSNPRKKVNIPTVHQDKPTPKKERSQRSQTPKEAPPAEEHKPEFNVPMPQTIDTKELESRMRAVAKEFFDEMIGKVQTVHTDHTGRAEDLPPEPPREGKGKRRTRRYGRITVTVDESLLTLFEKEQRDRSLSASRLLDGILWTRYGKPSLSYQDATADEGE